MVYVLKFTKMDLDHSTHLQFTMCLHSMMLKFRDDFTFLPSFCLHCMRQGSSIRTVSDCTLHKHETGYSKAQCLIVIPLDLVPWNFYLLARPPIFFTWWTSYCHSDDISKEIKWHLRTVCSIGRNVYMSEKSTSGEKSITGMAIKLKIALTDYSAWIKWIAQVLSLYVTFIYIWTHVRVHRGQQLLWHIKEDDTVKWFLPLAISLYKLQNVC